MPLIAGEEDISDSISEDISGSENSDDESLDFFGLISTKNNSRSEKVYQCSYSLISSKPWHILCEQ